jgi:hypothetical protein
MTSGIDPNIKIEEIFIGPGIPSLKLRGEKKDRVFVGGSYDRKDHHRLDMISDVVIACGHIPVKAEDYPEAEKYIRHYIEVLLKNCKLAILDCTVRSGAENELEFIKLNPMGTLCLWEKLHKSKDYPGINRVTQNNPIFVNCNRRYQNRDDVMVHVRDFLLSWS